MDDLDHRSLAGLLRPRGFPCVTLLLPAPADKRETGPRWSGLVRAAEKEMAAAGADAATAASIARSLGGVTEAKGWPAGPARALGAFAHREGTTVLALPLAVGEACVVADRFHVLPLLRAVELPRYYLLAWSQRSVRLLAGHGEAVEEMRVPGLPRSIEEALGADSPQRVLQAHTMPGRGATGQGLVFHGQGADADAQAQERTKFARAVARSVEATLQGASDPLVLACVEELAPVYRQVNGYPHLAGPIVTGSPDRESPEALAARARAILPARGDEGRRRALARYASLAGTGRTSVDLEAVLEAASRGKVDALLVQEDARRWGRLDAAGRAVEVHAERRPGDAELLGAAAAATLATGGSVFPVAASEAPAVLGAILRP